MAIWTLPAADANGAGKDDLIYGMLVEAERKAATFRDQQLNADDIIGCLGVADFNGDFRLDIVATTLLSADAVMFTNDEKGGYLFSSCSTGPSSWTGRGSEP